MKTASEPLSTAPGSTREEPPASPVCHSGVGPFRVSPVSAFNRQPPGSSCDLEATKRAGVSDDGAGEPRLGVRGTRLTRGLGFPSELPDEYLYQSGKCKNLRANNSLTKKVLFHIIKQCSDQINTHANGVIAEGLKTLCWSVRSTL